MVNIESAGISDVGQKRKGNEDSLFFDDNLGLFIVADGMGGHQAGEVASELVVNTMKEYMERFAKEEEVEELAEFDKTLSRSANRLVAGIHLANRVVYNASQERQNYRGMGSTVSAVYFTDDTLIASNVGDSPIYLVRNGGIETLSVLHTVLGEQKAFGNDAEKYFGKEYSHVLTRAMGVEKSVNADVCELPFFKEDILVIASDGLTDNVSPEEILKTVTKHRPAKSCQMLVNLSNERGGHDNITVIVFKIKKNHRKSSGLFGWINRLFGR